MEENNEIHLPRIRGRKQLGKPVGERARSVYERVFRLRRRTPEEWSLDRRRGAPEHAKRQNVALERKQGSRDRWSFCRNKGTTGWTLGTGSERFGSCS